MRTPTKRLPPLPYQVRADLFLHLATMEKAGLPAEKAWALLRLKAPFQTRVDQTRRLMARGQDVAKAGLATSLWTPLEATLLRAAFAAGDPSVSYKRMADYYQTKAQQWASIKSKMMLPAFMFVAALLIQPLPSLVLGAISFGQYIWNVIKSVGFCGLIVALGMFVHQRWQMAGVSGARLSLDLLLLKVPVFGNLHRRRNVCDYWQTLALLLEAGLPMFEALPLALETTSNGVIRNELAVLLPRMEKGDTLAQALDGVQYLESYRLLPMVETGEASGTLPEMLQRYSSGEEASLALAQQQLSDWLPRIVYAIVVGFMAYGLLSGKGVGPQIPADL
jgi:type II secretory pathway component PulF